MPVSFRVGQLIQLAKLGSATLIRARQRDGQEADWKGILPGPESETFDEIEAELLSKFPDGVILIDIS